MANFKGGKNRNDTFIGTQASDRFLFDPAQLTAADVIVGGEGKGRDVLVFTRAGTISADALANVIGIEEIRLSAGGNTIALTQGLIDSARGNGLVVKGGKGADRINASLITDQPDGAGAFHIFGGAGDDVLIGGRDDRLVLDGGKGADTIVVEEGTAVYDPQDLSITGRGDDARLAISTGMTLDLTRRGDLTDGDRTVVTGFNKVDASASRQSVTLIGTDTSVLTGGSGDDTIIGGEVVRGGKGRDTMIGRESENGFQLFLVGEGEFVAGETISGRNRFDQLEVTGSADLRQAKIDGLEAVVVYSGTGRSTLVSMYASQASTIYVQPTNDRPIAVDLYLEAPGAYRNAATYSYDVTLHGTAIADQIDVQVMNVAGGGGNDTIAASGSISGGAGNDHITFRNSSGAQVTIDGGKGQDLLALSNYGGGTIDLSAAKNQLLTGSATVRGFEDLDLAGWSGWTVTGSKAANRIAGSGAVDTINGGAGDDVIEGRGSADVLTGGEGRDTFRWSERDDFTDIVTDFSRKDVLSFDAADFRISGAAMDTRVVGDARPADLHGVDLFVYTGILNGFVGVLDVLPGEAGRDTSGGLFVAGRTGAGDTVLFHAAFEGSAVSVDPIAILGSLVAPEDLNLSQFAFI